MVSIRLLASLIASTHNILPRMETLGWRIVASSSFRFFLLLPMSFWPSCSIIFVGVVLPPSALFCVPTPLPPLVGSLRHFVSLRGVFSLFFRADISSSLFFGVCPFHFLAAVFLFALAPSLSGYGFLSFVLWLFSLSLPSSVSAPLLRCFCYTCCFCLGGSPLTASLPPSLFSCPRFPINYLLRLPVPSLLVTCLPPSGFGMRFRVLTSSFPRLSLAGSCLGGGLLILRFPLSLGFFPTGSALRLLGRSVPMVPVLISLAYVVRLHSLE